MWAVKPYDNPIVSGRQHMVQGLRDRVAMRMRHKFHEQRADLFMALLKPVPGMRLLDLGSGWGDPFAGRIARRLPVRVTLADVSDGPIEDARRPGFEAVVLREGEPLPFADGEFDIVVSNSVIEHVTLRPDDCRTLRLSESEWSRQAMASQRAFAREIQRVGRGYFVQTPHKHFPLDLHLWLPGTNWLPHDIVRRLVPAIDRLWIKKAGVADWHLLGAREMQTLFPDASVEVERLLGVPKSIVAYKRPPPSW